MVAQLNKTSFHPFTLSPKRLNICFLLSFSLSPFPLHALFTLCSLPSLPPLRSPLSFRCASILIHSVTAAIYQSAILPFAASPLFLTVHQSIQQCYDTSATLIDQASSSRNASPLTTNLTQGPDAFIKWASCHLRERWHALTVR